MFVYVYIYIYICLYIYIYIMYIIYVYIMVEQEIEIDPTGRYAGRRDSPRRSAPTAASRPPCKVKLCQSILYYTI